MADRPQQLDDILHALQRDPSNADLQTGLEQWLDQQPHAFDALVPAGALDFGIAPSQQPRRRQFLRNLLLHGYPPPRVEEHEGTPWTGGSVNMGIITGYFYPHALSLLEAG